MKDGEELKPGVMYYTKDGMGKVIKFNEGFNWETRQKDIETPGKTHTDNVWCASICRHIKDIAETPEQAKEINY